MARLRDLFYPPITRQCFEAVREPGAKRICFGSSQRNALKRANGPGSAFAFFNVPFSQSIDRFFPWDLYPNKNGRFGGYFRTIKNVGEFQEVKDWMDRHSDLVFIKTALLSGVAACEHYTDTGRSVIGEIEHSAKYEDNASAKMRLTDVVEQVYQRLFNKEKIHAIASVPSSHAGSVSLPNFLATQLAMRLGLPDLTSHLAWNGFKPSLKELPAGQKWATLEGVGMSVSGEVKNRNILLLDDMYQ